MQILQGEKMNLYEITDMKTGKVIEPVIALREASEKINCKSHVISNAYYGGTLQTVDIE